MAQPVPPSYPPPAWLTQNPVRGPDLLRVLLCQSVGRLSQARNHHAPQALYLFSDGTLGIALDDHHGYWREDAAVRGLIVAYNFRGREGTRFPEVLYLRIPGSASYLISPDHFHGSVGNRVETVLVPEVGGCFDLHVDAGPPSKRRRRFFSGVVMSDQS